MPRREYRCGYCSKPGHTVTNCDHYHGNIIFQYMENQGIRFLNKIHLRLNDRANRFHSYLMQFNVQELRLLISKINSSVLDMNLSIRGTKSQLLARIVHNYFFEILLNASNYFVSTEDNIYKDAFILYWWNISIGRSVNEALTELNNYFDTIDRLVSRNTEPQKFPITALIKTIDLTNEIENIQQSFECSICMEDECSNFDKVEISCNHIFCKECITKLLSNSQVKKKHPVCALCRRDVTTIYLENPSHLKFIKESFCLL